MSVTIKLKNSLTTTNVPSALYQGEAGINITDKKMWVGDSTNVPVLISDTQSTSNNTWTGKNTFNYLVEPITVSATAATGTINFDVKTQSVIYYTSNASANWTINFRSSSSESLNTLMSNGQVVTVVFIATNGATPYYNSAVTIDGNSVTPKWQGGSSPTSGNASSCDVYTYAIVKTSSATFSVFATKTQFA